MNCSFRFLLWLEILRCEKVPELSLVSSQDTPGFIVNRLLVPYMMEAIRLHERGTGVKQSRVMNGYRHVFVVS